MKVKRIHGSDANERRKLSRERNAHSSNIDTAFATIFYELMKAWYGDYSTAAKRLGFNDGVFYQYCFGWRNIPRKVLVQVRERRDIDYPKRVQEVYARVEKKHAEVAERLSIMSEQDKMGTAALDERIAPRDPTIVWTKNGYKPVSEERRRATRGPAPMLRQRRTQTAKEPD